MGTRKEVMQMLETVTESEQRKRQKQDDLILEKNDIQVEKMRRLMRITEKLLESDILLIGHSYWGRDEAVESLGNNLFRHQLKVWGREEITLRGPTYTFLAPNPFNAVTNTYRFDSDKYIYIIEEDFGGTKSYIEHQDDDFLLQHLLTQIARRKVNKDEDGNIWREHPGQCTKPGRQCDWYSVPEKLFCEYDSKYKKNIWACEKCFDPKSKLTLERK